MVALARLAVIFCIASLTSFASSITFQGPFGIGKDSMVNGPQLVFDLQDVTLSQPTVANGPWTLVVDTNYGAPLPGPGGTIPSFTLDFETYSMPDFLIQQGSNYYGIVLEAHDGYTPGDLYSASGFQDARFFHPDRPVYLQPGGTLLATGMLTAAPNLGGDGIHQAEFKITVSFNAPSTFLGMNDFIVDMSSADCANGFLTGTGNFGGSGSVAAVPEPGTLLLTGSALLIGWRVARRKGRLRRF